MQAKICATTVARLCHRTGTTLPTHWHNCATTMAQTLSCILRLVPIHQENGRLANALLIYLCSKYNLYAILSIK